MEYPRLYRKRLIPEECVALDADKVLALNEDMMITSWNTIRPKKDLHHGISIFYLKEGWKISYFLKEDDSLLYIYCDIISHEYDVEANTLTITDLLADVIVYPDGLIKVVDLDELSEAFKKGLITQGELCDSLVKTNSLLTKIYDGELGELTAPMDDYR